MAGDGAVGCLIFVVPLGAYQNGGHHGQRTESGGDHVAHHVAVVVLERPDEAALGANHPGNGIVNEGVEIGQALFLKLGLVFRVVEVLEDIPEGAVVLLGDGILAGKPEILLGGEGIGKAAPGEGLDGAVLIVLTGDYAVAFKIIDGLAGLLALGIGEYQLGLTPGYPHLRGLIHVAIGVTGDGDGRFPALHYRGNALHHNGGAEYGAVQNGADGTVGAFPHFVEIVFGHAGFVRGDGGAFHRNAVLFIGVGGVDGHLVAGLIPVGETQVVVFGVQGHEGKKQLFFDLLPEHPGHFVAVHFHQRRCHFNFIHGYQPPRSIASFANNIIPDYTGKGQGIFAQRHETSA